MLRRRRGVVATTLLLCLTGCPGGDPGPAGTPHAKSSPAASPPTASTPAPAAATDAARLAATRAASKTLQTGGDADFNGDGELDARTTIAGDTRTTIYFGAPGKTRLTLVTRGDSVDLQGDLNEDGTVDFKHTGKAEADTFTQTSTWDTDFDGTVDETLVMTFTGAPPTLTARHERVVYDPETGERKREVSERSDDGVQGSGPAVNHLAGFPTGGDRMNLDPSRDNIRVVPRDAATKNGCDEDQRRQLQDALANLELNQLDCLGSANSAVAAAVREALNNRKIDIACAPSSDYGAADVGPMFGPTDKIHRVNINPTTFPLVSFHETFLHEIMHVAGYSHIDDKEEKAKTDRTNTCASYCSGCNKDAAPSATPGADCARCSEPGRKEVCGIKKGTIWSTSCHRDHLAACLLGEYKTPVDCEKCLRGAVHLCDETLVGELGMPMCCDRCPAGTAENLACTRVPEWRVNTCFQKPPACRSGPEDAAPPPFDPGM